MGADATHLSALSGTYLPDLSVPNNGRVGYVLSGGSAVLCWGPPPPQKESHAPEGGSALSRQEDSGKAQPELEGKWWLGEGPHSPRVWIASDAVSPLELADECYAASSATLARAKRTFLGGSILARARAADPSGSPPSTELGAETGGETKTPEEGGAPRGWRGVDGKVLSSVPQLSDSFLKLGKFKLVGNKLLTAGAMQIAGVVTAVAADDINVVTEKMKEEAEKLRRSVEGKLEDSVRGISAAMHDSLSDKYQAVESWFASKKDELGGDAISEHIGALCAVFQPAASLLASLARNKMAAGELWRVHFESISSLLLVASALRAELSISDAPGGAVGASGSVPSDGEAPGGAKPGGELLRSRTLNPKP